MEGPSIIQVQISREILRSEPSDIMSVSFGRMFIQVGLRLSRRDVNKPEDITPRNQRANACDYVGLTKANILMGYEATPLMISAERKRFINMSKDG